MNERIKKLRKILDLTQQDFADRLGTTRNNIAGYEIGRRAPSVAVISLICREFNVSEKWLRTGEGEMFLPKVDTTLELLAAEHGLTGGDRILIEKFLNLKPEDRRLLVDYVRETAAAIVEQEAAEKDTPGQEQAQPPDIAAELAELKRQNQELTAKVAAIEEEDMANSLMDGLSASPSASAGIYNPKQKAKK